jgi:hypothetical protein
VLVLEDELPIGSLISSKQSRVFNTKHYRGRESAGRWKHHQISMNNHAARFR